MKRNLFYTVIAMLLCIGVFAQSNGFKYQAILRDADGNPIINSDVNFFFMITEGLSETEVYSEEQSLATNEFGLIITTVGEGTPVTGNFSEIEWSADSHSLEIEIDLNDGNGYQLLGSSPIMAVPYALHAEVAETVLEDQVNDADANPENEIQDLALNGNVLTITNNGTATEIDLSVYLDDTDTHLSETEVDAMVSDNGYLTEFTELDGDSTNEIQDLALNGNVLTITNNGTATEIDLSVFLDDTDTHLSETEVDAMVSDNGYLTEFTELDGDSTNEIQDLVLNGNVLTITNNGTATEIDLSVYLDDTDTHLSETEVDAMVSDNGYLTEFTELDGDSTNEIQDLALNGNVLTITNNGTATEIDLSVFLDDTDTHLSETEVDAMVSDNGYLTEFTELDGDSTNEIQDLVLNGNVLTITNNGTATEIDLSVYLDDTDTHLSETEVDAMVSDNGYLTEFTELDGDSTNEIQSLSLNGNSLSISDGNSVEIPEQNYYSVDRMYFGDAAFINDFSSTEYVQLKEVGTFTKGHDNTELEIAYHGLLSVQNFTGSYVRFQIRVDGQSSAFYGPGEFVFKSNLADGNGHQKYFTSFWDALPAGEHTLSIWIKCSSGSAEKVGANLGNFGAYFVIREYTNN